MQCNDCGEEIQNFSPLTGEPYFMYCARCYAQRVENSIDMASDVVSASAELASEVTEPPTTIPELLIALFLLLITLGFLRKPLRRAGVAADKFSARISGSFERIGRSVDWGRIRKISLIFLCGGIIIALNWNTGYVGVDLEMHAEKIIISKQPDPESPAEKAGLLISDQIVKVGGRTVDDLTSREVEKLLIKGLPYAFVRVTIRRSGVGELTFKIRRARRP